MAKIAAASQMPAKDRLRIEMPANGRDGSTPASSPKQASVTNQLEGIEWVKNSARLSSEHLSRLTWHVWLRVACHVHSGGAGKCEITTRVGQDSGWPPGKAEI